MVLLLSGGTLEQRRAYSKYQSSSAKTKKDFHSGFSSVYASCQSPNIHVVGPGISVLGNLPYQFPRDIDSYQKGLDFVLGCLKNPEAQIFFKLFINFLNLFFN